MRRCVVALAAVAAVACSGGSPTGAGPTGPAPATVLTLEDAGDTVTLRVGQTIIVDLDRVEGRPWSFFDYPEDILRPLVGQDGAPGRGFAAVARGTGTIVAYSRAGAGGKPPGTRFTLTVVVVG